jgi:hypothetical protein
MKHDDLFTHPGRWFLRRLAVYAGAAVIGAIIVFVVTFVRSFF